MGVVYPASRRNVSRPVALKVMRADRIGEPAATARFMREARAISELTSPHSVTLFDFGQTERGELFLVMEYLTGASLRRLLVDAGTFALPNAMRVLDQAACALDEAHQRGIVHRDIKPSNIVLVDTAGYPLFAKVLGFGIASIEDDSGPAVTESTSVPGTPAYLAPERFTGAMATRAADVYALGIMAYELLYGGSPFMGTSPWELMQQHLSLEPPPWTVDRSGAAIPSQVARFLGRCLVKTPELRPRDGGAFREGLRAALAAAGLPLSTEDGSVLTPQPVGRRSAVRLRCPTPPRWTAKRALWATVQHPQIVRRNGGFGQQQPWSWAASRGFCSRRSPQMSWSPTCPPLRLRHRRLLRLSC
ncbi:MAG: serine/threonine protein kinase [Myxococcota bacterium]|jgi:serine/threonine protein kinase